ncbi:MAG: hypothetical protein OEW08_09065, partial [Gammaproteobacteria bacterium]|nr:hypothetical protein [Gammaproteobacteria bacterium]
MGRIIAVLAWLWVATGVVYAAPANTTKAATPPPSAATVLAFDHGITGFPLIGQHERTACDACHIGQVFKGTPTQCDRCHNGLITIGKSSTHIPTNEICETCHTPIGFRISVRMNHQNIYNNCEQCHNSVLASGKSSTTHIITNLPCTECHNIGGSWRPSSFRHDKTTDTCVTCHEGKRATGKGPRHITTENVCDACHNTQNWRSVRVDHLAIPQGVLAECSKCHNGVSATGKKRNHVVTTEECILCHNYALGNWQAESFATVHGRYTSGCVACHNGLNAPGKKNGHPISLDNCEKCHSKPSGGPDNSFADAKDQKRKPDHSQLTGSCFNCHSGPPNATGKGPSHISSTNNCERCHIAGAGNWVVAANKVDHSQVFGLCTNCHNNIIAQGKSETHLKTTNNCDYCHRTTAWVPTQFDHSKLDFTVTTCVSCHDGVSASGKGNGHIPINSRNACAKCHVPGTTWVVAAGKVDHTETVGNCEGCHNAAGNFAQGKSPNHIPSTNQCATCHTTTATWKGAKVDHAGIRTGCVTCHNGVSSAKSKLSSASHPLTSDTCEACHGVVLWKPVVKVDHNQVIGACETCHLAKKTAPTNAKPHIASDNVCGACHSTVKWNQNVTVNHGHVIGACITCHAKTAGHLPTSDNCKACHSTFGWLKAQLVSFDHKEVSVKCYNCHNGSTTTRSIQIQGKTLGHINSSSECAACHSTTGWKGMPVDHTQVIGTCFSCHNTVIAKGKGATHAPTTNNCEKCHVSTRWAVTKDTMNHNEATAVTNCKFCHNGARGKTATHILSSENCAACHAYTGWKPILFTSSATFHAEVIGGCSDCHNGVAVINNIRVGGKGPLHILSTAMCEACHVTNNWGVTPATKVDHAHVSGPCFNCHNNSTRVGGLTSRTIAGKTAAHLTTSNNCGKCHGITPLAWKSIIKPVDHIEVIGTCESCHNNVKVAGKPATHIPTTVSCNACHKSTADWKALTTMDHTQTTAACNTCHNGTNATGVTATHIATNGDCKVCHSYINWVPITVAHSAILPQPLV